MSLSFNERAQVLLSKTITQLNEVECPDIGTPYSIDLMARSVYSAYFGAIADLLVGSMAICSEYTPLNSAPVINTTY
jgi:hypothetical protein